MQTLTALTKLMKFFTPLILSFLSILFVQPVLQAQTTGTADGTYDFGTLGAADAGGAGFKTQGDKFKVSNVFTADVGNIIYANNNSVGGSQTAIIKAQAGTTCKSFTLKNMTFSGTNTYNNVSFSVTLTLQDLSTITYSTTSLSLTTSNKLLSAFNNLSPAFPASGVANVVQMSFTWRFPGNAPNELNFVNVSLANISAATTWTGATSTEWATATNWNPTGPPTSSDAVIIPNVTNAPVISSGNYSVGDLTIASGAVLTLSSGVVLSTYGDTITNYGKAAGPGKISIAGTTTSTKLIGNGFYNILDLISSAGAAVGTTTADSLKILTLCNVTVGTFTTQGRMVLKSSDTLTAALNTPAGSNISGGVTVERYIASNNRKKYVLVATPITSVTMYNSWQEAGAATTGYGTQVTGLTGSTVAQGFDAVSNSGLSSVFTYNDNNADGSKWVSVTNTKTENNSYTKGYLLFVRGDRTVTPGSSATGNTILRAKGGVIGSGFTQNLTSTGAGKYNLLGNAYACPLDWTLMSKTGITNTFTVYDPNLGVFVTSTGSTVSPSESQQQPRYIQSGQAFFIQNGVAGATSYSFTGGSKVTSINSAVNTTLFDVKTPAKQLNVNVYSATDNEFADGVVAVFGNEYKKGTDAKDADKFTNLDETFAFKRGDSRLSIDARPLVNGKDTLFFSMSNFAKKDYILKVDGANLSNTTALLIDNYTNSRQDVDLSSISLYKFTVNGDAASANADRFMIVLGGTATIAAVDVAENTNLFVKLSPNPVSNQLQISFKTAAVENTVINVVNALGQIVKTIHAGKVNTGNIKVDVSRLAAGNYTVQLLSGNNKVATKKIVKE